MMELEEKKIELINLKAELASRSTSAKSSEIHFDEKISYEEDIKQLKASSIILKRKIEEQKLEIYNLNQNHQNEFEKQKLEGTEYDQKSANWYHYVMTTEPLRSDISTML